jgi:hypothetical protein
MHHPYSDGFYHPLSLMVNWGTVCCCFTNSSEHVATINLLVEGDSAKKTYEDWPGILVLPNPLVKDNFPYSIQYPLYGYTVYTQIFNHNHIPSGYLLYIAMVLMAYRNRWFTILENGWIFPWRTVSHNQMVFT